MNRLAIRSRDIAIVGYDPNAFVLEVTFRAGGVYRYRQVPADVHQAFLSASSQGMYFRNHIREQYRVKKIA
jgi:hypothetical protein